MRAVARPLDSDEVTGPCVGLTNSIGDYYDRQPDDPQEPVGEGGWLSDGMGAARRAEGLKREGFRTPGAITSEGCYR